MRGGSGASVPHLAPPALDFHASFLAALREYHSEGRHAELDEALLTGPAEFTRYAGALRADVAEPGASVRYVAALRGDLPASWPDGYVPQTQLWWVRGTEYLGRLTIRHDLTPHLLFEGGNIGFDVRPGARRRGHATAMLAAALPLAAAFGVDPVRIDCLAGNVASRRVIETNGGVLDGERDGNLYFWAPAT